MIAERRLLRERLQNHDPTSVKRAPAGRGERAPEEERRDRLRHRLRRYDAVSVLVWLAALALVAGFWTGLTLLVIAITRR